MTDELPLATANGRLPFGSQAPVGATDTMMHIFCFVAPVGAFEYKLYRIQKVGLGLTCLNNPLTNGPNRSLCSVGDTKLSKYVLDMLFDCFVTYAKRQGYLFVCKSVC